MWGPHAEDMNWRRMWPTFQPGPTRQCTPDASIKTEGSTPTPTVPSHHLSSSSSLAAIPLLKFIEPPIHLSHRLHCFPRSIGADCSLKVTSCTLWSSSNSCSASMNNSVCSSSLLPPPPNPSCVLSTPLSWPSDILGNLGLVLRRFVNFFHFVSPPIGFWDQQWILKYWWIDEFDWCRV
jgi:hypothetical protein